MRSVLEIACFNSRSAEFAEEAGADRIELAENYSSGGITASEETIKTVLSKVKIPVHLLIRPRAGNFVYNTSEKDQMKKSVLKHKSSGISAFVIGALTEFGDVDKNFCRELMDLAGTLPCYFHRAIDSCKDTEIALQTLIALNFKGVLCSGGKDKALDGKEKLKSWQRIYGEQLEIIAGGGIRAANLLSVMDSTCPVYHSSALVDDGGYCSRDEVRKLKNIISLKSK